MSDTRPQAAPWSTIDRLRQWWRGWREAKSGLSDLNQFGDYEVERTARELGTSVSAVSYTHLDVYKRQAFGP